MKIILRIISLPIAWLLWTIHYSYHWVKNGGSILINDKPLIKPEEFYVKLLEVNNRLRDFESQKDEALYWKRLYENYDLEHCGQFVKQEEEINKLRDSNKSIAFAVEVKSKKINMLEKEIDKLKQELANNAFKCLQLKKQLKEVTQEQVDDYVKSIETEQGLTTNNYPSLIVQHEITGT